MALPHIKVYLAPMMLYLTLKPIRKLLPAGALMALNL